MLKKERNNFVKKYGEGALKLAEKQYPDVCETKKEAYNAPVHKILEQHDLAKNLPTLSGADIDILADDIKAHGLNEPIVLLDGKILDGYARYTACKKAGVEPLSKDYDGSDPFEYVISANLHRRHLTIAQRASIAERLVNTKVGRPKIAAHTVISQTTAAEIMGVSADSIQRAKKVRELNKDLAKKVFNGSLALSDAYCRVTNEKKSRDEAEAAAAPIDPKNAGKVRHGDAREVLKKYTGKIDLLFTDPPYGIDYHANRGKENNIEGDASCDEALALLADVLSLVVPKMATNSHAVIFVPNEFEPDFRYVITKAGLKIKSYPVWVKPSHIVGHKKWFVKKHERMIHAVKGDPKMTAFCADVLEFAKDADDKRRETLTAHPTVKPIGLLREIIRTTTKTGMVVCDPFAGSGGTLIAAAEMGRDFIGAECEKKYHKVILNELQRLAATKAAK